MKKKNKNPIRITKRDLQWTSFEDVLTKASRNTEFRRLYAEETLRHKLANRVRELRALKQLTQKMVAKKAGMPQSVIARIESGDRGISVDTLGRVANAFGKEVQLV